jgi:hypothetical protein
MREDYGRIESGQSEPGKEQNPTGEMTRLFSGGIVLFFQAQRIMVLAAQSMTWHTASASQPEE